MGPSNDHELEIAREIDKISERDRLCPELVPEILAFLDFKATSLEFEFLKRYMKWRMDHSIAR